jgi:hypothetical protein
MSAKRILICGGRDWTDPRPIVALLAPLRGTDTVVIHGAARGADSIAAGIAKDLGLGVDPYPADWTRHGKAAGPIRNTQMLAEGQPTEVHAFHANIAQSKGTKDMVAKARRAGIPVVVHDGRSCPT